MTKLTHQDADLVLKVYEMRRETVMRESRTAMMAKFWPKSFSDVEAVLQPNHELNAAFRQTSSYWEMIYGFARNGITDPDFFIQNNGEGLFILAKVKPFLAKLRETYSPLMFQNAEWIATNCEEGKKRYAMIEQRVEKMKSEK